MNPIMVDQWSLLARLRYLLTLILSIGMANSDPLGLDRYSQSRHLGIANPILP
jgi:hypothetical protein